jgi:hypothetical protein
VGPPVVGKQRIGTVTVKPIIEPGRIPSASIRSIKVIAEVVVVKARPDKQAAKEKIVVDNVAGPEEPGSSPPEGPLKINWSEKQTATVQVEVPVAFDENITIGGPDVVSRDPYPAGPVRHPVPRLPGIAVIHVSPVSWHEDTVFAWSRR